MLRKAFVRDSARYRDEDHGSTVLRQPTMTRTKDNLCRLANASRSQRRNARRWNFGSESSTIAIYPNGTAYAIPIHREYSQQPWLPISGDEEVRRSHRRVPKKCQLLYHRIGETFMTASAKPMKQRESSMYSPEENFKKAVEVGTTTSDGRSRPNSRTNDETQSRRRSKAAFGEVFGPQIVLSSLSRCRSRSVSIQANPLNTGLFHRRRRGPTSLSSPPSQT